MQQLSYQGTPMSTLAKSEFESVLETARAGSRPSTLGRMLLDAGKLSSEELSRSQATASKEKLPLGQVLVRDGFILSRDIATLSALHLGLPMVDLRSESIDPAAVALVPEDVARRYIVLPLSVSGDILSLALSDPTDVRQIQDLALLTGHNIELVISTQEDILEHIDLCYRVTETMPSDPGAVSSGSGTTVTLTRLREAPPAKLIELLLRQAAQDRASDIHIEPGQGQLRVRLRIDGILHDAVSLPLELHPSIVSRVKIMCGMNIAERRRPQDGHMTFEVENREVDVRVAVSNTVEGEMVVLRLLDKQFTLRGLEQLGMNVQALEQYRRLLRLPYGMVVVCGPTGAGKSTTLYASILQMNRQEQNVISLEDPVEYRITDVNQMQMQAESGITFGSQLRSILRLDPDVILVGEIRDQETAVIATQAALTGHLVLTSLHANDSVSALIRLRDLGVASYLLTSSLAGVVAQRMVRVVCGGCQAMTPRPLLEQEAFASVTGETQERFMYGSGCNSCARTGYMGRTGVLEVLSMSDRLRQLFLEEAPRHRILEQGLEDGMIPMRRDGMMKVKQGITTLYEVMRVLFSLEE